MWVSRGLAIARLSQFYGLGWDELMGVPCSVLVSYSPADWSRLVHTAVLTVQEGAESVQGLSGLGSELTHYHFCILLTKACNKASRSSWEEQQTPSPGGRNCTLVLQRADTGISWSVTIFAVCLSYVFRGDNRWHNRGIVEMMP